MSESSPISAYQQAAARGASPLGLVIALYDTILRDLRRALAALDSGAVETRVFELNHALTVIAHLSDVLDHQRGGIAASRLSRFYQLSRAMILEANASGSRQTLAKLVDLYAGIRQSWEQAERHLASPAPAGPTQPAAEPALSNPPPREGLPPASSGRWSA